MFNFGRFRAAAHSFLSIGVGLHNLKLATTERNTVGYNFNSYLRVFFYTSGYLQKCTCIDYNEIEKILIME